MSSHLSLVEVLELFFHVMLTTTPDFDCIPSTVVFKLFFITHTATQSAALSARHRSTRHNTGRTQISHRFQTRYTPHTLFTHLAYTLHHGHTTAATTQLSPQVTMQNQSSPTYPVDAVRSIPLVTTCRLVSTYHHSSPHSTRAAQHSSW